MRNSPLLRAAAMFLAVAISCAAEGSAGLKNTTVLVIRHAEKPESGPELTPAGFKHAEAYVKYFSELQVDGQPLKPDALFAAADTKNSHRPRLTLEPLSRGLHLPLDTTFKDKEPETLAAALKSASHGKTILICWHHGKIPDLLHDLDADPATLIPGSKWPDIEFSWVIELRYDADGKLIPSQCRRIEEHLTP